MIAGRYWSQLASKSGKPAGPPGSPRSKNEPMKWSLYSYPSSSPLIAWGKNQFHRHLKPLPREKKSVPDLPGYAEPRLPHAITCAAFSAFAQGKCRKRPAQRSSPIEAKWEGAWPFHPWAKNAFKFEFSFAIVSSISSHMSLRSLVLLLGFSLVTQTSMAERNVDFSNYDLPLYLQVVNRIKATIAPRLEKAPLTHDRYFIVPFAYQNKDNDPEFSHSFITVIRVFANKPQKYTPGLRTGTYKKWDFEAYTISWLPADFLDNPHLCVFDGVLSHISPESNHCPVSPGHNFNLEQTIKLASTFKLTVAMWGPYEIAKQGFDLGVRRKQLLDSGKIKYRADDRLLRKKNIAINCFHAMAGLEELYPNGGLFGTGFMMWGFNGTARVLIEYSHRARYKGLLLDPVNEKADRYGFVYAPVKNGQAPYDPIQNSSAYHRG